MHGSSSKRSRNCVQAGSSSCHETLATQSSCIASSQAAEKEETAKSLRASKMRKHKQSSAAVAAAATMAVASICAVPTSNIYVPAPMTTSPYFSMTCNAKTNKLIDDQLPCRAPIIRQLSSNNNASVSLLDEKKKPSYRLDTNHMMTDDESEAAPAVKRTHSFDPLWAGTLDSSTSIRVHTLILGTHPSIASLSKSQYFAHPMNAFWWIAGDCLGFRRSSGISPSSGKPYLFTPSLRYSNDKILSYDEQLQRFASRGFALWDVIKSCERKGSLDMAIQKEIPNDIRMFCKSHPTVKRIILANGTTQSTMFLKHYKDWWNSGELRPAENKSSVKAFSKFSKQTDAHDGTIICVCAISVSPAAATYSYEEKRQFWEEFCYMPGLVDHKRLNLPPTY